MSANRSSNGRTSNSRSSNSRSSSGRSSSHIRIHVVDDHPAIHEAIRDSVEEVIDMEICGTSTSAQEALRKVSSQEPDIAVVDISLGDAHGLDLVELLAERFSGTEVIVFSMYDEEVYAERSIRAGASGYLMKSAPTGQLVEAIRRVEDGKVYLSRQMASRILGKFATGGISEPRFAIDQLTEREMQVFRMLGQGRSIREIAEGLDLSRKTVETHRRRAKEKLDFDSVSELLQYAVQWSYGQDGLEENGLGEDGRAEDSLEENLEGDAKSAEEQKKVAQAT